MPEPNENLEQNCTIRIHLIIDSVRQKIKNKETGRYSNSSYEASQVLICTRTAAIILRSPLPSAAKCTTSHQPHGARLKATMEMSPQPSLLPKLQKAWVRGLVAGPRGESLFCFFTSQFSLSYEKSRIQALICSERIR